MDFDLATDEVHRRLTTLLEQYAPSLETPEDWPRASLHACGEAGVHRWFVPEVWGGYGWNEEQVTSGYLMISRCCVTTAFILTQRTGAMKRIVGSPNARAKQRWLPGLVDGSLFGTVGISHLTTSRQHVKTPALQATKLSNGTYRLDGYSPWVTGATHADVLVVGATLENGEQILVSLPADRKGISAQPGCKLVALSASCTDRVDFSGVLVEEEDLLFGPIHDVMKQGVGAGTGGLQTSTLAIGLSVAAIEFIEAQVASRPEFSEIAIKMRNDVSTLMGDLVRVAAGQSDCSHGEIRQRANSLALRSTQAALTSAKGAGFVQGHPAGRWAREALFFLVWSCPQPVLQANRCELAGL